MNGKRLISRIVNVLSSSGLHQEPESNIRNLLQQASLLDAFELQSSRTVGFVGDAGVGKSSLLNSLLDYAYFARTVSWYLILIVSVLML